MYEPSDDTWLAASLLGSVKTSLRQRRLKACADIGSGTGFLGLYTLVAGICEETVFVDVYDNALLNTRLNIDLNGLGSRGLVVSSTEGLRDSSLHLVVSNPPYLPGVPSNEYEASLYAGARGFEVIVDVVREAHRLLVEGGLMVLVYSSLSNTEVVEGEISRYFNVREVKVKRFFFEELKGVVLEKKSGGS
ncbi:methyltransferase [Thermogladius sp.]|uniref:methyltransferase n=1 Tax=Thermogladius sp. TaxID=2023064 RepID=UPI003D129891